MKAQQLFPPYRTGSRRPPSNVPEGKPEPAEGADARVPRHRRAGRSLAARYLNRGNVLGLAVALGALLVWQIVALIVRSVYIPPVTQIISTFFQQWFSPLFTLEAVPSLYRLTLGYLFAVLAGVGIGLLIGTSKSALRLLEPCLQFLRSTPPVVMIPIGVLLIGIGDTMKIVVIAFGAMWPILLNAMDGARLVPTERLQTARIFGLSRFETVWRVVFPSATPMIAAGMRTALSIALVLIVVSELIASTNGIGYYILDAQRTFAIPQMYGGILLLAILGYVLNTAFVQVEQRVMAWHYGATTRPK
jgi:ABC-type nitrate/sulfonate/bicarbonate transport system permease component